MGAIQALERQRYLKSEPKVVGGKVRKYYRATLQGKKALLEAYAKAHELLDEISAIEDLPHCTVCWDTLKPKMAEGGHRMWCALG